jgi:uncharacterized protein
MEHVSLYAMLLLGLLGTGHCIGMCGPLAFAFPGQTGRPSAHLAYHLSRIAAYGLAGVLLGGLSAGLAGIAAGTGGDHLLWVARIQIVLSLAAAGFLLLFGLNRLGFLPEPGWMSAASPAGIPGYGGMLRRAITEKRPLAMLVPGFLNGLLPCGLSYAAFARSLAAGGPLTGGLTTLVFGLGTLPGLLLIGCGAAFFGRRYRRYSDILSGVLMIGMGLSLGADAVGAML